MSRLRVQVRRCRDWLISVPPWVFVVLAASWAALLAFLSFAKEVREREPVLFDEELMHWLHSHASASLDPLFLLVTRLGNFDVVGVSSLIICVWLVKACLNRQAAFVVGCVGGAAAFNVALKLMFERSRPTLWPTLIVEKDFSFPSGHAMVSSAFAAMIMVLAWPTKYRAPGIVLGVSYMVLVGLSRMYLGVHFPSDVMAGWCASLVWTGIVFALVRPLKLD